jgi:RluA family pseudouridine synthase
MAELEVRFEDGRIAIVDKPAGMAAHPAQGVEGETLQEAVARRWPGATLLHRLDREASGLVVVAKAPDAALQQMLERHELGREYLAVLGGRFEGERVVERPIEPRSYGRAALQRKPSPDAQPARSVFAALQHGAQRTLVKVLLSTGRKPQIRIHAAWMGHPIAGDRRYGGAPAPRLALHAARLVIPDRGIDVASPLPAELAALLA